MRIVLPLVALLVAFAAASSAANSEWLQTRHDARLSSKVPVALDRNRLNAIQHGWTVDLRPRTSYFEAILGLPGASTSFPTVDYGSISTVSSVWRVLEQAPPFQSRSLDFIPSLTGIERLTCGDLFVTSSATCIMTSSSGATIWEITPLGQLYAPVILFEDTNGDGVKEIIIVNWTFATIVRASDGVTLHNVLWKNSNCASGRHYGWIEVSQMNLDVSREICIAADFQNSLEFMGLVNTTLYDSKNGQSEDGFSYGLSYSRCIEPDTHGKQTEHHVPRRPLRDLLGVGYNLATTNIFNEGGDGKWHVQIRFFNGTLLVDIPDRYCRGFADVNGDGAVDLLLVDTFSHVVPRNSTARIVTVVTSAPHDLFVMANADFAQSNGPAYTASQATTSDSAIGGASRLSEASVSGTAFALGSAMDSGHILVLLESRMESLTGERGWLVNITAWQWSVAASGMQLISTIVGPNLRVASHLPSTTNRGFLISSQMASSEAFSILAHNARVTALASVQSSDGYPMHVQASASASSVTVWTGTSNGVFQFTAPAPGQTGLLLPSSVTRMNGLGMYSGEQRALSASNAGITTGGVVLARLLPGSAELFSVFEAEDVSGASVIQAVFTNGTTLWSTIIPVQGGWTLWNRNGVTLWQAAPIVQSISDDILVNIRFSSTNSDRLYVLRGTDGSIVWQLKDGAPYGTSPLTKGGAGGNLMPLYDVNGDGCSDIFLTHASTYAVVDGVTGGFLFSRPLVDYWNDTSLFTFSTKLFSSSDLIVPTASLIPSINSSHPDVFIGSSSSNTASGVASLNGTLRWVGESLHAYQLPVTASVGSVSAMYFNGICASSSDNTGVVRLVNSVTGALLWQVSVSGSDCYGDTGGLVVDLDGDGSDEFIYVSAFSQGFGVVCIGSNSDNSAGAVLWTSFPVNRGLVGSSPSFVVLDNSPLVLVGGSDGQVYGFDAVGQSYINQLTLIVSVVCVGGALLIAASVILIVKCCCCKPPVPFAVTPVQIIEPHIGGTESVPVTDESLLHTDTSLPGGEDFPQVIDSTPSPGDTHLFENPDEDVIEVMDAEGPSLVVEEFGTGESEQVESYVATVSEPLEESVVIETE